MRLQGTSRAVALAAALLAAACGRADATGVARPTDEPIHEALRCSVVFAVPSGYRHTETTVVPEPGRLAIRESYRDRKGRGLHVSAGIVGEFGEGARTVEEFDLLGGRVARLYGAGDVWVLTWDEGGPCGFRTVTGSGMDRERFVRILEIGGLV